MTNILVLCHANRYRSPLAAALLARDGFFVKSAALNGKSGLRAGAPVRAKARELRLDLEDHRSRAVSKELLAWAQVVVCMNPTHASKTVQLLVSSKVVLLGAFADPPVKGIPDLAFLNGESFEATVRLIQETTRCLGKALKAGTPLPMFKASAAG